MRSVFTVNIPKNDNNYPTNPEILNMVRGFGWEPVEITYLDDEVAKEKVYKELAEELFKEMPEIAVEEQGNVIFYGFLADDQTKFVITRRVEGQMTFRLLHPVLPRLQTSTTKMVRKIMQTKMHDTNLSIANQSVVIYERGHDHIILNGRVIPNPFKESLSKDRKNALLFLGPLTMSIPLTTVLAVVDMSSHKLLSGTLERTSTAFLTTAIVSALGFFQTYYETRRYKLIAWTFTIDSRSE